MRVKLRIWKYPDPPYDVYEESETENLFAIKKRIARREGVDEKYIIASIEAESIFSANSKQNSTPSSYSSDASGYRDAIDGVSEFAGAALVLGAKGIWQLGKFGARKIRERQDKQSMAEAYRQQQQFDYLLANPRDCSITWIVEDDNLGFTLDGSETLAAIDAPGIIMRWLDDALDNIPKDSALYKSWVRLESNCRRLNDSVISAQFFGIDPSTDGYIFRIGHVRTDCLYVTMILCVKLLKENEGLLDEVWIKKLKRLENAANEIKRQIGENSPTSEVAIETETDFASLLQADFPTTPLNLQHLQTVFESTKFDAYRNEGQDESKPDASDLDTTDNSAPGYAGTYQEGYINQNTSRTNVLNADDYTSYSCHLYLPSKQIPSGWSENEGVFVLTQDVFLFIGKEDYESMDLESLSRAVNNIRHPQVSWRSLISDVTSLEQKREFFRSVLYIRSVNDKVARLIFSPGLMQEAYGRISRLVECA